MHIKIVDNSTDATVYVNNYGRTEWNATLSINLHVLYIQVVSGQYLNLGQGKHRLPTLLSAFFKC